MNDPQTRTTGWGLTVGAGGGLGGGGQRGKNWDTCNGINMNFKKEKKKKKRKKESPLQEDDIFAKTSQVDIWERAFQTEETAGAKALRRV